MCRVRWHCAQTKPAVTTGHGVLKFIPGFPTVPGVEFVGAFWFRFSGAGSDCRRWMSRWPPKPPRQKLHDNIVNVDFAPSVAQADAVLAQFGFVDREVAVAA